MKLHLERRQAGDRRSLLQYFGLSRPTLCWEIRSWWELTAAESKLLARQRALRDRRVFYYSYHGLDLSPCVATFTRVKSVTDGFRFVAHHPADAAAIEDRIREGARELKNTLQALDGETADRTSIEGVD